MQDRRDGKKAKEGSRKGECMTNRPPQEVGRKLEKKVLNRYYSKEGREGRRKGGRLGAEGR